MNKYFGFGVDLSYMSFKGLNGFMKEYATDILHELNGDIFGIDLNADEDLEWWISGYFEYNGYSGMAAFLTMVINENENLEFLCSDEDGGYIFVPTLYPWQFDENMNNLTPEKVNDILKKWISKITDDPIEVKDIVLYCDIMDE